MRSNPISPGPVRSWKSEWLPPYVANGIVGLRLVRAPFGGGTTIVNGFVGTDPTDGVETFAPAPFALALDLEIGGIRVSESQERLRLRSQRYDFATAELSTTWRVELDDVVADIESVAYASHVVPSLVVQETTVRVSNATELAIVGGIRISDAPGAPEAPRQPPAGGPVEGVDGTLTWVSHGELTRLGMAYATDWSGSGSVERTVSPRDQRAIFGTTYRWRGRSGAAYRFRQLTALVPELAHREPALQAGRMAAVGVQLGWPRLRADNRDAWSDLWEGRIEVDTDDDHWQAICDATFFYLLTSVHPSSVASTSLFGLAWWPDYHYYHGHVMWDLETFVVPVLSLLAPESARTILAYRVRHLDAARRNAALMGRLGACYPWESCPLHGEEATPGARPPLQDHVSLDVALALVGQVQATGDRDYARRDAWPVLRAVAEYVVARVVSEPDGFHWRQTVGPREIYEPVDDNAFVNMAASRALHGAIACAELIGETVPTVWQTIADRLVIPVAARRMILNHAGATLREEQGGTPEGAAGLFPVGYRSAPAIERATYRYAALRQAARYVGSPMLSALLPVYAVRAGDRTTARRLLEAGYGQFMAAPYSEIDEFQRQRDEPHASPMFANMGGFLLSLLYGFPALRLSQGPTSSWVDGTAMLPAGWREIRAGRIWARQQPHQLVATHGKPARLEPGGDRSGSGGRGTP
jgi:trehalose/maltose hydrolase-like predicted phosphorylase